MKKLNENRNKIFLCTINYLLWLYKDKAFLQTTLFQLFMFINALNLGEGTQLLAGPAVNDGWHTCKQRSGFSTNPCITNSQKNSYKISDDVCVYLCICSMFVIPLIKMNTLIKMKLRLNPRQL